MRGRSTTRVPPVYLTPRDLKLLQDLSSLRFASVSQLAHLYFGGSLPGASARLRRLLSARLVCRVHRPIRFEGNGAIYGLSSRGSKTVSARLGCPRLPFLRDFTQRSALFLDHTLARNDVRIALLLLDRDSSVELELVSWKQTRPDVELVVSVPERRRRTARVPLVPDGVALVSTHRGHETLLLEVDMATVRPALMARRYRAYHHAWRTRQLQRRFGPAPVRVLTLTTHPSRLERLHGLAQRAPEGNRTTRLFWSALLHDIDLVEPGKLLGPVWSVTGGPTSQKAPLFSFTQPPYETKTKPPTTPGPKSTQV